VHDVKEEWGVIWFTSLLYGETPAQWEEMKRLVDEIQLNEQEDRVSWGMVTLAI
jgi:hypothetical protein